MRINKYVAQATGLSRRAADKVIDEGRVNVNGVTAVRGQDVAKFDRVTLDGHEIKAADKITTIMLNKPVGYVVSRNGQGSKTIYDLLPARYHHLKPVGRLDKDSSGLLLLTNDGDLAQELTHPKYEKTKVYEVELDRPLTPEALHKLQSGVRLEDGMSHLDVHRLLLGSSIDPKNLSNKIYRVQMHEGRNRQIRRTFAALGYKVTRLHRTHFGDYKLNDIPQGKFVLVQGLGQ
ncbi:rRNA pseudouridine synthase [Candidatus Saccharibacteria bacterium]|nr:rRNA pseudouridine synthase [Candidatus Saccharibacteria bacterium]